MCIFKEGVNSDIRSLSIISNIGVAHAFVLWCWRKEVLSNFELQVRLQLKEHYYKELFEFFPDAIALYTKEGVSYVNKCCVQAFRDDKEEDVRLSPEEQVEKSFRHRLKQADNQMSLDSQAALQFERIRS